MLRPEPRPEPSSERDHHAGPPPALDQPRGHDARPRPGATPPPPPRSRPGSACGSAGGLGGEQDARLGLLAVAVEQVELAGDLLGAGAVLGEQQLERGVGAAHAAGGVDARAEPEAERVLGELGRLDRRPPPSARAGRACGCARARRGPRARCGGSRRAAGRGRRRWRARRGRGPPRPRAGRRRRRAWSASDELERDARGAQLGAAVGGRLAEPAGSAGCTPRSRAARRPAGGGR